jgi:hypothetical protein
MGNANVKITSERNPSKREPDDRAQPFLSVLLAGLLVVPLLGVVTRLFAFFAPELLWLIAGLSLGTGGVLAAAAIAIGFKVAKRIEFVVWHVATTALLFGIALYTTTTVRWPELGEPWYIRLLAVVNWPAWWVIIHFFGSIVLSGSWLLYRIDAFRAATGTQGDRSGFAELLGIPAGVTVRKGSIEQDEYATTAIIDHENTPADKVASILPAMVEKAGAIRGRSTIIPGERGGSSTVRIVHNDPMKDWRTWPGLSHPGMSFAYPFRSAYYSTGEGQWYSFAKTPDSPKSPHAPKFRAENDAHLGRQGATRAGKSGDIAVEIAEGLSRKDCIVVLANAAKLMQDSGWCLDMVGLAADTTKRAAVLFAGLKRLGEYRSTRMGDPRLGGRHRTWTPETYEELGFAALLVEVDEGDLILGGSDVTWLSTKGLSLGIYASVSISRAVTDGMASTLRSAIPTWKAFGAGQDYDKGFALSKETMAAGASPESFGTRFPGAHYLDKAQGVAETLYPVDARSFKTQRDFSDLRRAVEDARESFPAPTFTAGEIRALGDAWTYCQPKAILFGALKAADQEDADGAPAPPDDDVPERPDMTKTLDMSEQPDTGDPVTDALMSKPREDFSGFEREFGALPPISQPIDLERDPSHPGGTLLDDKPRVSPAEVIAEFDAALVRMARRGVTRFGNRDVIAEMTVMAPPAQISKHFKALCDEGKTTAPPAGIGIERVPGVAGQYDMAVLDPDAL